jgi:hypothetical membrane protein
LSQQKEYFQQLGEASGIVAPIVAFTCVLTAIASYPEFSWKNNALSDLGIISGITGAVFNFGLYCGGLFVLIFAMFGLFKYLGSWMGKIGALSFAATGLALMGIGFFPENVAPYHYLFSMAFFVLLPISLFIITGAFTFKRQKIVSLLTLLTAVAAATPWILYFAIHYVDGVAIPEFSSALAGSVWVAVLSYKMLKVKPQARTE